MLVELAPGTGYETSPATAKRPELQFLLDYWQAKRGERAMPSRADISIRELKAQLCWISMIDVLPETGDFRYRVVGTRVVQYFRSDTTGKTVSEAFASVPEAGAMMLGMLRNVASNRIVVRSFGNLAWMGNDFEDRVAVPAVLRRRHDRQHDHESVRVRQGAGASRRFVALA